MLFLVALAGLAGLTFASADMAVHEKRDTVPVGFVEKGPAPADQLLDLRVALVQRDVEGLEKVLYDVSTPGSASYGQHLSKEAIDEFVRPTNETTSLVNTFFLSHNVTTKTITSSGVWISFSVPASKANEMFDSEFTVYEHEATGRQFIRTLSYSIPTDLKGHLDLVHPTVTFDRPFTGPPVHFSPMSMNSASHNLTSRAPPASCASIMTPACLQSLYGIPATLATQKNNTLVVSGFLNQFAQQADLTLFLKSLRPDLNPSTSFSLLTIDGGSNPQGSGNAGIEADLDIEYTVGVASGVPVLFASVGSFNQDGLGGFLDLMNQIIQLPNLPTVITTSYNGDEDDFSTNAQMQLCTSIMTLGVAGVSVLFSSGDGGVGGAQSQSCTDFVPTFPSTCPFITTVGATIGIAPEVGAGFTSGGFSNIFPQPTYQLAAVSKYLSIIGNLNAGLFNRNGRAYPDVSAQGQNVEVAVGGQFGLVAGTSCSSPIFASVIALLNDRLIASGRRPLGFLNPMLYTAAGMAALTDITQGNNPGCNTNGFPAEPGWDAVTGLGTPIFEALLSLVGL